MIGHSLIVTAHNLALTILPDPQRLADIYALPEPISAEALDDRVSLIRTATNQYALKVYRWDATLEEQRYEHWLLMTLLGYELSFDLPYPVRNQQGATFHSVSDTTLWVLSPLLHGDEMKPNDPDQAYAAGAALGELHSVLADVQPLLRPNQLDYTPDSRVLPGLRGPLPTDPAKVGLQNTPESQHRLKRFIQTAEDLKQPPPAPTAELRWHIVHGGFFGSNLLYDGERVSGVLDFKNAHPDFRAREFAHALMNISTDLGSMFWAISRAFVEGYAEHLRLSRAEIALLPRFVVEQPVHEVMNYVRNNQPAHAANILRWQEEISAWLEVEETRFLAMLRGIMLGE